VVGLNESMKRGILGLVIAVLAFGIVGCSIAPKSEVKVGEENPVVISNSPEDGERGTQKLSETVSVGKIAPDFELPDETGKSWKLSDYKGKVVLLDFWGFWCSFCVKELPELRKMNDEFKDKDFVLLGINTDKDELKEIQKKLSESVVNWRQGMVPGKADLIKDYQVTGFPTKVLIDREGKIVYIDNFITKADIEKIL
jgi:peroxiredoxin